MPATQINRLQLVHLNPAARAVITMQNSEISSQAYSYSRIVLLAHINEKFK